MIPDALHQMIADGNPQPVQAPLPRPGLLRHGQGRQVANALP